MRRFITPTFGALMLVQAAAAVAGGQARAAGSEPTACSILSTREIEQITKRTNRFNIPPQASAPPETPKGVTECDYLGITVSLTAGMTAKWFDQSRESQIKNKENVERASGIGDDAYYWSRLQGSNSLSGLMVRIGSTRLSIMDMLPADSIAIVRPTLVALAKAAEPKLR